MYSIRRKEIDHEQTIADDEAAREADQKAPDAAKPACIAAGCASPGSFLSPEAKPEMTTTKRAQASRLGPLLF